MAQSLVKLSLESNQYERGMRQAQKTWNDFMSGIGLSMKKISGTALAIGAVTGALKVAKDAFFNSETQLDDWNRAIGMAESTYKGFLNSLNNGDISGFLSNIGTITEAAKAAYNAIDELSTFNAFNQIQTQKTRTGFTEAMAGYRLGEGSKENVQKAAKAYQDELRSRMEKEEEAYTQAVRKIAAERGVAWGNLEQALTGKYGDYEKLKNIMPTGKRIVNYGGGMFGGGSYEVPMAITAEEKMGEALRKLNDTELKELQALGAQAYKTSEEIAQIDKQMARVLNGRQPGAGASGTNSGKKTGKGSPVYAEDSIAYQEQLVSQLTKKWKEAGNAVRNDYAAQLGYAQAKLDQMMGKGLDPSRLKEITQTASIAPVMSAKTLQGGMGTLDTSPLGVLESQLKSLMEDQEKFGRQSAEVWQNYQQQIEATQHQIEQFKGVNTKGAEAVDGSWRAAASAISSVGSALQQTQDPGAKILGIIGEAIANIASGFAAASAKEGQKGSVWYWIAATAAGLASMVSTIQQIHSATGYASGGVIGGTHFSGDVQYARVNAGETILNQAQAGMIANALQNGGLGGMHLETSIDAEQLRIILVRNSTRRNGRRSGYEYTRS